MADATADDDARNGIAKTYMDPCPECGARTLAVSKEGFIRHLRDNGEGLTADIHEQLVVS